MSSTESDLEAREAMLPDPNPSAAPGIVVSMPTQDDLDFIKTMKGVTLLADLDDGELNRISELLHNPDGTRRRLDLLEHYYAAMGNALIALQRITTDRFFLHRDGDDASAASLIKRLGALTEETESLALQRIGGAADGPLVIRAGEQLAAVTDVGVDEVGGSGTNSVAVRSLVRGLNALLDRLDVVRRFVPLRSDNKREAYVAVSVTDTVALCKAGYLDETDREAIFEFAGW